MKLVVIGQKWLSLSEEADFCWLRINFVFGLTWALPKLSLTSQTGFLVKKLKWSQILINKKCWCTVAHSLSWLITTCPKGWGCGIYFHKYQIVFLCFSSESPFKAGSSCLFSGYPITWGSSGLAMLVSSGFVGGLKKSRMDWMFMEREGRPPQQGGTNMKHSTELR